jgi:hypothetical protein
MNRMKWWLPVLVGVIVLGLLWWVFRARSYTARDLMARDNPALLLILADMDEKEVVRLRQEMLELRRKPANPAEGAEVERVLNLTTNVMRQRGIDEKKAPK